MKIPWFHKKELDQPLEQPFEAELPDDDVFEIDFNSPTWKYIEKYLQFSIQAERANNDSIHLNEQKTALIRGKIRAYKDFLDLNSAGNTAGILNAAITSPARSNNE